LVAGKICGKEKKKMEEKNENVRIVLCIRSTRNSAFLNLIFFFGTPFFGSGENLRKKERLFFS
jgi:hypothetical protein